MARSDPTLTIRIPEHVKKQLEECAKESGRSVTSELVTRLEASFADDSARKKRYDEADRNIENLWKSHKELEESLAEMRRSMMDMRNEVQSTLDYAKKSQAK